MENSQQVATNYAKSDLCKITLNVSNTELMVVVLSTQSMHSIAFDTRLEYEIASFYPLLYSSMMWKISYWHFKIY